MKTEPIQPGDTSLDATLRQWTVASPLPAGFQEQVWHRIARVETNMQGSFWAGLVGLVARSCQRPRVAYSWAAVLLAFGIAAGSLTAQVKSSRLESQLGQRYVLSVDPFLQSVRSP